MTRCAFIYKLNDALPCENETFKGSKYCKKHKYYNNHNIKNANDEDTQSLDVNLPYESQESGDIADTLHNRAFVYQCIKDYNNVHNVPKSNAPAVERPPSGGGGLMDYLPMIAMALIPVLKHLNGGGSDMLNIIKNLKGLKPNNIVDEPATRSVPNVPVPQPVVPIVPPRNTEINIE